MANLNAIGTLEGVLVTGRKTLSEFQTGHLKATITYLKGLKKDFPSARKEYEATMKEIRNER